MAKLTTGLSHDYPWFMKSPGIFLLPAVWALLCSILLYFSERTVQMVELPEMPAILNGSSAAGANPVVTPIATNELLPPISYSSYGGSEVLGYIVWYTGAMEHARNREANERIMRELSATNEAIAELSQQIWHMRVRTAKSERADQIEYGMVKGAGRSLYVTILGLFGTSSFQAQTLWGEFLLALNKVFGTMFVLSLIMTLYINPRLAKISKSGGT